MDVERMRDTFQRQLEAGLPETAVFPDGSTATVSRTNLRADFAASQYGTGSGYDCSVVLTFREGLPGRDGSLSLNGRQYVVIGRQDFGGISVRLDLREGY